MQSRYAAFVQPDDQMPADKHHRLWVQSPNGTWCLLAGGWGREAAAAKFAISAGYTLIDAEIGIHQVETQMKENYDRAGRPPLTIVRRLH